MLLLLGQGALVTARYCNGRWGPCDYDSDLEIVYRKQLSVDGEIYVLGFQDTSSQEDFRPLLDSTINRANVILLCFSLDDRRSFDEAVEMDFQHIRRVVESTVVILVGLKLDLVIGTDSSCVSFQEAVVSAIKIQAYGYFQCSARADIGLDDLFQEVCRAGMVSLPSGSTTATKKSGFFGWFSKKPKSNFQLRASKRAKIPAAKVPQTTLSLIPNDIWVVVMEYLDFLSLIRVSRTCKQFYHLTMTTKRLWLSAIRRPWNYHGFVKGLIWKNASFTWDPEKRFHVSTCSTLVSASSSRHRSDSDEFVCFGPNATILMSEGQQCPMKHLLVGDRVLAYYDGRGIAPAVVQCIWKCPVHKYIPMVTMKTKSSTEPRNESVLEITPDHPILLLTGPQTQSQQSPQSPIQNAPHSIQNPPHTPNNTGTTREWCLPTTLREPHLTYVEYVYNLVLEPQHHCPDLQQQVHTTATNQFPSPSNASTTSTETPISHHHISKHQEQGAVIIMVTSCDQSPLINPPVDSVSEPISTSASSHDVLAGVACCTLGMSVPGHPDDWWGTDSVIHWLHSSPCFPYVCAVPPPNSPPLNT
ncbi:hypothetical protein Pelo_829 [Pelomyxa schiedti]|nr:hypothetical protein Pelo_829 [Pelomyxa schiedti]